MKPGEIYILNFPFSDLSGSKKRPGLIISTEKHNQKTETVIMMALSTNLELDYSVIISDSDLKEGSLFGDKSAVQYNNLFRAHNSLISKKIMVLKPETFKKIINKFNNEVLVKI
ncbi:MAG: type II toxin-antitoxin system PemK/MazF family toxin [Candidatus Micrarchaeia archaeon]|jgi:mRNA interferase MazF